MKKITTLLIGLILLVGGFIVLVSIYLPLSNPLQKADAIVAVSGGDTHARAEHAIDLYEEGWAPKLIFSGAAKDPASASNARVMLALAAARGVPATKVQIDENSRDTKENAIGTKQLVGDNKTVILVTSEYHQRRVYREFKKAYGGTTHFINSPAKDKNWDRKSWFLSPYGWWISVTELAKLVL